jgi:hypothetical protein
LTLQKIVETLSVAQLGELAAAICVFKEHTSAATLRLPMNGYFSSPVNVTANEVKAIMQVFFWLYD